MKKILLSFFLITGFLAVSKTAMADPCGVSNLYFKLNTLTNNAGGSCTITFDIGWDQTSNNGNKWSFAHLWLEPDYPGYTYGSRPTGAQLTSSNAIGTVVVQDGIVTTGSSAYPGGTTTVLGGTLVKTTIAGGFQYRITGISKTFTLCPSSLSIKGDVWSSNSGFASAVHCFNANLLFLPPVTQDLNVAGTFFCGKLDGTKGREIKVDLSSVNSSTNPVSVSYDVFVDNGNGSFNAYEETLVSTRTVSGISVYTSNPYTSGRIDYLPYSNTNPFAGRAVWIAATATTSVGQFNRLVRVENSCALLPVKFKSVSATRNKERVAIKWETASESNNRGFNVQRNTNGEWKNIAFVFSQANEGTSSSTLSYQYNDVNTAKGVSQYRVQQVDMDGKAAYSEIRSVRGETMKKSVIAFPNPSLDGKVSLVLEDNSAKNVIVSDMSGRIVKQYKNITANNLSIDMLQSGMYSIQVTDLSTAEITVEKVVIKKR